MILLSLVSKSITLKKNGSSFIDYTLYKHSDLNETWIICEGHLNYRYDRIKLLNISQFAIYYVVLAKIPTNDNKEIMTIYLYRNQQQKPSNFFQLNEYERISDQCSKPVKSKYFLFELTGKHQTDIEIFGANNVIERDNWIKYISEALDWTKQNLISDNLSINEPNFRRSWKEDSYKTEHVNAYVRSHYEPFVDSKDGNQSIINNGLHNTSSVPSTIFMLPHRSPPPIRKDEPLNSNNKKQNGMHRSHSFPVCQTTEKNVYLQAQEILPSVIKEDDEISHRHQPTLLEDRLFTWDDIFYSNELQDHARVLNDIGEIGAFLIRPQSENNHKLNEHKYTLSIYAFGGIIKYRILYLSNNKISLINDINQPSFDSIPNLCQYYTNHPLPRSSSRDNTSKASVGNLCLKWPYTYYLHYSSKF
ncbi:unnamed protein product [Adineta steineri]|uniref:SH2 domain-containing protein n=1 Tax=Adineta steineri TaxID=433720 RepID=A0A815KG81_9BILA|nr:unnamed protein product [Adineta steineri]CAF3903397.1 unnamed protein product [Adineta steineri]